MPCCPIWTCKRWYSAALVDMKVTDNGKARIATKRMEKAGKFLELTLADEVLTTFEEEKIKHDYGLIVAIGTSLADAKVVAFVSFYREHHNPDANPDKRISPNQALKQYDDSLDELFFSTEGA